MTAANPAFDGKLLALLTGALGNSGAIGKSCGELGSIFSTFLPDLIENETGLKFTFNYDHCEVGMKDDLIADLDEFHVLIDGSIKNWCDDFTLACPSTVITAMVECMLGGDPATIVEPMARAASSIELQMAPMITDHIASVVKSAVSAPGNYEPILTKPYNAEKRPKPPEDHVDVFAALIRMKVELGAITSSFSLIVPQKTLLKTQFKAPTATVTGKTPPGWTEQLQEQVRRSEVKVEARIRLRPLKLGTLAKLQVGDVIPFLDHGEVRAQVSANGRDLYDCEFGRSGEQYTVRVRDTVGGDGELLSDLISP